MPDGCFLPLLACLAHCPGSHVILAFASLRIAVDLLVLVSMLITSSSLMLVSLVGLAALMMLGALLELIAGHLQAGLVLLGLQQQPLPLLLVLLRKQSLLPQSRLPRLADRVLEEKGIEEGVAESSVNNRAPTRRKAQQVSRECQEIPSRKRGMADVEGRERTLKQSFYFPICIYPCSWKRMPCL